MNCDEAFEALTDPDAQHDSALKWHLDFCPRCREMQQVLAPALAMFSAEAASAESEPSRPSQRLPADFLESAASSPTGTGKQKPSAPFLTPEAVRVAEQTAKALHPGRDRFAARWQRWAAVGLLCLMAVWGTFFVSASSDDPASQPPANPAMLAEECLWTNRHNDHVTPPPEAASSRWVVLSCVSCHLEQSLE